MYGIPTTLATQKTNSIAVAGFIEQFAQTKDLTTFLTRFRTDLPSTTTFATRLFDGGKNTQSASQAGIEANLGNFDPFVPIPALNYIIRHSVHCWYRKRRPCDVCQRRRDLLRRCS
jgi:hypothetical protein